MLTIKGTLDTMDLLDYALANIYQCQISEPEYDTWHTTNLLVRSILITNMTKEVAIQMSHLKIVSEVWDKAQRLFSGQTMKKFTLTITSLITLKYVDGEDPAAYIVKMQGLRQDLMLMNRDIDDGLFACFLQILMLPSWNYVFSGLPQAYTSAEVKCQIKDEHGIKLNQESTALAYRALPSGNSHGQGSKCSDPYCTNCNRPGHVIGDCWSKAGGAEGKGPQQKRKQKKNGEKDRGKHKFKGKEKANQAMVNSNSDDDTKLSVMKLSGMSYMAVPSTYTSSSCSHWILDGGATCHICQNGSSFTSITPATRTIGGINGQEKSGLQIFGRGKVVIRVSVNDQHNHLITLHDVVHCPHAQDNLISEGHMDKKGFKIVKWKGKVIIKSDKGEVVMQGRWQGLYIMDYVSVTPSSLTQPPKFAFAANFNQSLNLWHWQFAHIHENGLCYAMKHGLITGLTLNTNGNLGPCNGCTEGKHHQALFLKQSYSWAEKILNHLHIDLQGPFNRSTQVASTIHWWLLPNWLETVSTLQKWCSQAYQKPYHWTWDWHWAQSKNCSCQLRGWILWCQATELAQRTGYCSRDLSTWYTSAKWCCGVIQPNDSQMCPCHAERSWHG